LRSKNRRNRPNHATGTGESPRSPHASAALDPAAFAGLYPYQPFTIDALAADIERLRAEAADDLTAVHEAWDRHERKLAQADDYERLLSLIAEDAARRAQVPAGPAMGRDLLLNGTQPGFEPQPQVLPYRVMHDDGEGVERLVAHFPALAEANDFLAEFAGQYEGALRVSGPADSWNEPIPATVWHAEHPYDACPEAAKTGRPCAQCAGLTVKTLEMPKVQVGR
jgi:hypothetical protein